MQSNFARSQGLPHGVPVHCRKMGGGILQTQSDSETIENQILNKSRKTDCCWWHGTEATHCYVQFHLQIFILRGATMPQRLRMLKSVQDFLIFDHSRTYRNDRPDPGVQQWNVFASTPPSEGAHQLVKGSLSLVEIGVGDLRTCPITPKRVCLVHDEVDTDDVVLFEQVVEAPESCCLRLDDEHFETLLD